MAYNTNEGRAEYTASAGQTLFTFNFKIYAASDILVYQTASAGTPNDATDLLTETTHYTVVITGDTGGTITLVTGATVGDLITLKRSLPDKRAAEYITSGDVTATNLNDDQDYQTYMMADNDTDFNRSVRLPDSVRGIDSKLPTPSALKFVRWNAAANALENIDVQDPATVEFLTAINISALMAMSTSVGTINVLGYYTANDGGGDPFNWDATIDKSTADGGVTIDPSVSLALQGTGIGFGCWVRQYTGAITAKKFGVVGGGIVNDQVNMQRAWDYAYLNEGIIDIDFGKYLVDTIEFPPASVTEMRGDAFIVNGRGAGNAFVLATPARACTFIGSGDAPAIRYVNRLLGTVGINTGGAWGIGGIRIEANSTTPAVQLDMMGEYSYFQRNEIYQAGIGDGVNIDYPMKGNFEKCNILNRDLYANPGTVTRVGAGVRLGTDKGGGIFTMKKISARGFDTSYVIGDGGTSANNLSGFKMEQCECSVVDKGIDIRQYTLKATIDTCYFEGIESKHIIDAGTMTDIYGCIHFYNPRSTGGVTYVDLSATTYGNSYHNNYLEARHDGDTLIEFNGNYGKSVYSNELLYSVTTAVGLTGINITGGSPDSSVLNNAFSPRGDWLGTGTTKIRKSYTGTPTGFSQAQNGSNVSCPLLMGAIVYVDGQATLTEAHVSGNTLTIPDDVNSFTFTPTVAVSINTIVGKNSSSQPIHFHVTNTNVTFTNSALLKVAGGTSYTGIGAISFLLKKIGATHYGYEMYRATYV